MKNTVDVFSFIKQCQSRVRVPDKLLEILSNGGTVHDWMAFPELEEPGVWPETVSGSLETFKNNAKTRGIDFSGLTEATYDRLTQLPCTYCRRAVTERNRSGIDRIDSGLGYVDGNMCSCCSTCNTAKGEQSAEDFAGRNRAIDAQSSIVCAEARRLKGAIAVAVCTRVKQLRPDTLATQLEKFEAMYDEIAARADRKANGEDMMGPVPQTHNNFFGSLKAHVLHNKGFRDACPVDDAKRKILRKYPIWDTPKWRIGVKKTRTYGASSNESSRACICYVKIQLIFISR